MAIVLSMCLYICEFRKNNKIFVLGHELSLSMQLCGYLWIAAYYVLRAGLLRALMAAATATCLLAFVREGLSL